MAMVLVWRSPNCPRSEGECEHWGEAGPYISYPCSHWGEAGPYISYPCSPLGDSRCISTTECTQHVLCPTMLVAQPLSEMRDPGNSSLSLPQKLRSFDSASAASSMVRCGAADADSSFDYPAELPGRVRHCWRPK